MSLYRKGLMLLGLLALGTLSEAADVPLNGHVFTLPEGFKIELVADSTLVPHPISADFDELGRLYVTDSSGTNDPSKKQLEDKPHRIVRLEDTNGDGVFDKSSVWADKLMFPEGAMWHAGSLYVAAPPSIWKLTDTDNDGVADQRVEWFKGETLTGCANDVHGPFMGLDGWIYWCKGAFAEQNYVVNGKPFKTRASHVFRARPDGTGIEPVMTGGMDNPVDLAFMPNGDVIVSNTFLVHPGSGQAGERDGLIHAIYGGVYGKEHGVLDGHPRTGELMPILSHQGASAPCGLTRYDNDVFGSDYRDNLFCCQFNKHKVSRHVLKSKGASYESLDSDFVVSSNIDFHPTDVFEDADGSLLIVDTGGWYKLCCPTSQLHKPDILGAIYRVRRKDAPKIDDPRGLKIDWARVTLTDEVALAKDRRPVVRRAFFEPRRCLPSVNLPKGPATVPVQQGKLPKMNAEFELWWGLARTYPDETDSESGDLVHPDLIPMSFAHLRLNALTRKVSHRDDVEELLEHPDAILCRAAAEVLGRLEDRKAIGPLLKSAARADDRHLQHAFAYALIEIADPVATAEGLKSDNANVRRVALIALDQMPGGGLKPEQVTPLLTSTDAGLQQTARWIVSHHPEWGGQLAGFFEQQLAQGTAQDEVLVGQFTQFASHPAIQELLAKSLSSPTLKLSGRSLALSAIGNSKPKELPPLWAEALSKVIGNDSDLRNIAVETARKLPPTKAPHADYQAALLSVANDTSSAPRIRLAAMATIATTLPALNVEQFSFVTTHLSPTTGISERAAAADVIAHSRLSTAQLDQLTTVIQDVSPLELDRLLAPFERSTDEALGLKLIATLKQAKSLTSLRMDSVKLKLAKHGPAVLKGVDELNSLVNVDAATQKARLEELLPQMKTGDIRRGLAVYNSQKASCIACHKLAYLGGNVGPDLSKIGGIRTERDLLESILYPSLSFVRSYEPVTITTHAGKVFNGQIRNETATEITLATGLNQEVRITRADIDEQLPGKISIMPTGLDKQLSVQELADLVTFLKSTK